MKASEFDTKFDAVYYLPGELDWAKARVPTRR